MLRFVCLAFPYLDECKETLFIQERAEVFRLRHSTRRGSVVYHVQRTAHQAIPQICQKL